MQELVAFLALTLMTEAPFWSRLFDLFAGILTMPSFWAKFWVISENMMACSFNNKLFATAFKPSPIFYLTAIFCISSRSYGHKNIYKTSSVCKVAAQRSGHLEPSKNYYTEAKLMLTGLVFLASCNPKKTMFNCLNFSQITSDFLLAPFSSLIKLFSIYATRPQDDPSVVLDTTLQIWYEYKTAGTYKHPVS